jgi:hypothetical protein
MKLKELIRQLEEYTKIYSSEMEIQVQVKIDSENFALLEEEDVPEAIEGTINGIDYVGDGLIMISCDGVK